MQGTESRDPGVLPLDRNGLVSWPSPVCQYRRLVVGDLGAPMLRGCPAACPPHKCPPPSIVQRLSYPGFSGASSRTRAADSTWPRPFQAVNPRCSCRQCRVLARSADPPSATACKHHKHHQRRHSAATSLSISNQRRAAYCTSRFTSPSWLFLWSIFPPLLSRASSSTASGFATPVKLSLCLPHHCSFETD